MPDLLERTAPPEAPRRAARRRTRTRRRLALGVLLAVVLAAGGAAFLGATGRLDTLVSGGRPEEGPERQARSSGAGSPSPSGPGATSLSGPGAQAAAAVLHRLRVVTHPEGASVRMVSGDGQVRSGTAPFEGRLPAGDVTISVSMDGRNPETHRLVLGRARLVEVWLDPEGLLHDQVAAFETGSSPKQVAFTPDGAEIWVTPLGEPGIEVYSVTGRRLAEIPSGEHGTVEVIFTADGRTAYVSQMQTASVLEVDVSARRVTRTLQSGGVWSKGLALSADEETLFVANWSSANVSEIDLPTGRVRRLIPTVSTPRGLYPTGDGRFLYVAGYGDGEIQRIDLTDLSSEVLLRTGGAMRHLVGDPQRRLLYADDMATDEVYVVELRTAEVRKLADTDATPNTIDLTPDGRVLYVSNRGRNGESYYFPGPEWGSVLAIDTATGRPLDAMVGGNQPTGLDVSPDGRFMAYSDFLDNRVSVFAVPPYGTLSAGGGGRFEEHFAELEK